MLTMDKVEAPTLAGLPLEGGTVVVAGAYKGDTVRFLLEQHKGIKIYAFEPQAWAYEQLPGGEQMRNFNYALGDHNGTAKIYENGTDAASLLRLPGARTQGYANVRDARQVFGALGLLKIDLFFMNIEGYEYTLLPYLLDYGLPVDRWLIQFHFSEKFGEQWESIRARMHSGKSLGSGWWLLT